MLAIIVAIDPNNLIGVNNKLPWHYPTDLKYFKKVTMGKAVLMGYNTYLSIVDRLGTVLPGRKNYVLTYEDKLIEGAHIVDDIEKLIKEYENDQLFVIGGKMVYETLLNRVDYLYLTRVQKEYEGDTYFPAIDFSLFELISSDNQGDLVFEVYKRIKQ